AEQEPFNDAWRFHKGAAEGAEAAGFDDSEWREVRLPHDWAIEGPFDPKYNARCGGLPFHGTGWYRKEFATPDGAGRVAIGFDGAMYNAHVWVNGQFLGHRPFGYIGFEFDMTEHLHDDGTPNVIAVRLQPEDLSSRWYPGAGLYRNVWLRVRPEVHVPQWGVEITTPSVTNEMASVAVTTHLKSASGMESELLVRQTILDATGEEVATAELPMHLEPASSESASQRLAIRQPQRWDIDS
ncbi:unnamed protein product, partial [Ectocarpus sp. 4 AP-2014]